MDDIRGLDYNQKLSKQNRHNRIKAHIKKHIGKYILYCIVIILLFFPSISGDILGTWLNNFILSFTDKITFIK